MAERGFKMADAYVEIHADKDALKREARAIPGEIGPELDKAGQTSGKRLGDGIAKGVNGQKTGRGVGDKVSEGMRMAFLRNSPLIVAAIGGALAAGAPLALAGAGILFAGIGALAAAQSEKVRQAWVGLWDHIKDGAISDAAILVPVYERMAQKIGAGFDRMRPQIRQAFTDSAPLVDIFTDSVVRASENALPGLVRAVTAGRPVMEGFGHFLESIGTGVSEFFDAMSAHAPAAGTAFAALGDIIAALLPTLGELLGSGAELAATVLPPLATVLQAVASAVGVLGPLLPPLVMSFAALKVVNAAGGFLKNFAVQAQYATIAMTGSVQAGERVGGVLSKVGSAAAGGGAGVTALAVGIGVWAAILQQSRSQIDGWVSGLNEGGQAARDARAAMEEYDGTMGRIGTVMDTTAAKTNVFTASMSWAWGLLSDDTDEAREANEKYLAGLTPVEAAQRALSIAEKELGQALKDHGAGSDEVAGKQRIYDSALRESERANAELEQAIHGVTQAMLDQANQALAAADSGFAYQEATYRTKDAQDALAEAIREHGKNSEEAIRATTQFGEALSGQAQAAGRAAADASGLTDKMDLQKVSAAGTLQELYRLRDQYGSQLPASLQQAIAKMEESGVKLDWLGEKRPTPVVDANIDPLTTKVGIADGALAMIDGRRPLPGLDLNTGPFNGKTQTSFGLLDVLGSKKPTPTADLNPNPMNGKVNGAFGLLDVLGGRRPTPTVGLNDQASGGIGNINRNLSNLPSNKTITVTQVFKQIGKLVTGALGMAGGGPVGETVRGFDGGGTPQRRSDGKLVGPGGPLDDLIPAVTNTGERIRVANDEWIVRGAVADRQGDDKMAALNAGLADIVLRSERRFGLGGAPAADPGTAATMASASRSVRVDNLTVKLDGHFDIRNPAELRRLAIALRTALENLSREER